MERGRNSRASSICTPMQNYHNNLQRPRARSKTGMYKNFKSICRPFDYKFCGHLMMLSITNLLRLNPMRKRFFFIKTYGVRKFCGTGNQTKIPARYAVRDILRTGHQKRLFSCCLMGQFWHNYDITNSRIEKETNEGLHQSHVVTAWQLEDPIETPEIDTIDTDRNLDNGLSRYGPEDTENLNFVVTDMMSLLLRLRAIGHEVYTRTTEISPLKRCSLNALPSAPYSSAYVLQSTASRITLFNTPILEQRINIIKSRPTGSRGFIDGLLSGSSSLSARPYTHHVAYAGEECIKYTYLEKRLANITEIPKPILKVNYILFGKRNDITERRKEVMKYFIFDEPG
ncbi:uncharacterized protein H6S33_002274 [Morchella sextelata]|uniref:uncharacterized protein n=1 Tax=Morchella sextelata TaxID=1174677 RepID=UPI001D03791B|nr:uncharacterized protein H6S33_002274 [Morchella sextelata]KAH0608222.1 hypothetical protein H6S33_002274 [Morchella sextelata]